MEVAEDEEVVEVAFVEEETSFSEGNKTINQLLLTVVYIGATFFVTIPTVTITT